MLQDTGVIVKELTGLTSSEHHTASQFSALFLQCKVLEDLCSISTYLVRSRKFLAVSLQSKFLEDVSDWQRWHQCRAEVLEHTPRVGGEAANLSGCKLNHASG